MSKKAGAVVIEITAGTARAIVDIDKLGGKIKQLGSTASEMGKQNVSGLQASSAALREVELNFGHNIRAVENFMSKVLGLGPVFQAIFPVVGGLAFAGLLVDLGKKVHEFYRSWQDGPAKAAAAFAELRSKSMTALDDMTASTDRLQNELDKLMGKPRNGLKEAIDDAIKSADKLGESLAHALDELSSTLEKNKIPWYQTAIDGGSDKDIRELIGGPSGKGEYVARERKIQQENSQRLRDARNMPFASDKDQEAAMKAAQGLNAAALQGMYDELLGKLREKMDATTAKPKPHAPGELRGDIIAGGQPAPSPGRITRIQDVISAVAGEMHLAQLSAHQDTVQSAVDKKRADNANAKIERPAEDAIRALESQLKANNAKAQAAGGDYLQRAVASGNASADVKIESVRKALERTNGTLSKVQEAKLRALEIGKALAAMETEWADSQRKLGHTLDDRTTAQTRLTAAVGKGYEAEKDAAIENQLQQAMGERYNKAAYASDQAATRAKIATAVEADHTHAMAETIDRLGDELAMTQAVTAAVTSGAYAIRLATEAERERQALDKTHDPAVVAAMRKQFDADEAKNAAESAEKIRQETAAIKARTGATWQGAMAQRAAELQAKYTQMGAAGGPNADAVVAAEKQKDIAQLQGEIATQASRAGMAYQSSMEFLNRELVYLQGQGAATKETLAYQISLRSVEDERLKLAAAYALEQRTALAGVRSFFLEMQTQAESSAKIIYDALNRALDDTSANLAKMLTGQKASWGEMFRSIGQQMVQSSTKSLMQQGLGQLGKMLGINIPGMGDKGSKPGDSPENPIYTSEVNASKGGGVLSGIMAKLGIHTPGSGKPDGTQGNPLYTKDAGSGGGGLLGMFSGGDGGGGGDSGGGGGDVSFGGGMAQGGYMSPDKAYMTGEEGIELITKTSGYVTRNSELGRMMGEHSGGSTTYIDARGTDPALTEARVKRAMKETHSASVGTSMKTAHEQAARRPKK